MMMNYMDHTLDSIFNNNLDAVAAVAGNKCYILYDPWALGILLKCEYNWNPLILINKTLQLYQKYFLMLLTF